MPQEDLQLTPEEAEEVLKRFRAEEEELQKRMEARATNPTVADLAEGLGVPAERITRLLSEVRTQPSPLQRSAEKAMTQEKAQSNHLTAWIVGIIVFGLVMIALITAVFTTEIKSIEAVPPPPVGQNQEPSTPAPEPTSR